MEKETFNLRVLPLFTASLLLASIGVFVGFFIPPILYLPIVIAELIVLLITAFTRGKTIGYPLLIIFVFLSGITTTPIVAYAGYVGGAQIILEALAITTVSFGSLAFYVYTTGNDFRKMGPVLMISLIALILASIVNIFLGNPLVNILLDVFVLLVFLGFVLYDMSKILRDYPDDQVVSATLALYLDFLNIFIRVLQLLVASRQRD